MGVCSNKSVKGQISLKDDVYLDLLDITHPLNVNRKYANHFTIIPNRFVGEGIRRTFQYTTKLSRESLDELRKEFWGRAMKQYQIVKKTPCSGRLQRVPQQSRTSVIVQLFLEVGLNILTSYNLRVIGNSIQLCVCEGQKYLIPVFLINEPTVISPIESSNVKVRIRSKKLPPDYEIITKPTTLIKEIKQNIMKTVNEKSCRLYLNGIELQDQQTIANFDITSGTVFNQIQQIIQAFL